MRTLAAWSQRLSPPSAEVGNGRSAPSMFRPARTERPCRAPNAELSAIIAMPERGERLIELA
jgi:hypothetical protein